MKQPNQNGSVERQIYECSFVAIVRAANYWDEHGDTENFATYSGRDFISIPYASKMDVQRTETAIAKKMITKEATRRLQKALLKARQLAASYEDAKFKWGEIQDRQFMANDWEMIWRAYFALNDGIEGGKKAFRKDYGDTMNPDFWEIENSEHGQGKHAICNKHNILKLKQIINKAYVNATKSHTAQPAPSIV